MPIFEVRGREQKLSFQEMLEGLRSGELQREDLPEAVSKHLIGQWRVHAFQEAVIKAGRQKVKKPMKMEDRRLQDPPIQEAQALWAFRDLSEGISHLITQLDGRPRQIVQTFYQHTGGDLAHAVQGGGAVGWNLSWWGGRLPQLGNILQGKEPLDSPTAREWFVNYLETLTHEMVHITEGSDDWTHHADFSAKQRRFVEGLIRSSSKVEEVWRGVTQKYPDGTLPKGALDVYVLSHSKFVEIEKSSHASTAFPGRSEVRQIALVPAQPLILADKVDLPAIIEKSQDIPASLFFAYDEVKEKGNPLWKGLLAVASRTQGSKLKLVIYNADRTDLGLKEFRDLGVEVSQEGLDGAFRTFGEKANGRNVNASTNADLLKEQLISLSGLKLKHLLIQDESEIWAAYLRAITDPDQTIPGLDGSQGYDRVVGEFLRSELRRYQANLVIIVAA